MAQLPQPHPILLRSADRPSDTWCDVLKFVTGGYWIDENHWLHGPDVLRKPVLPEALPPSQGGQPFIYPRSAILHTNAGSTGASSLWGWLTRKDVNGESHFQNSYDRLEQYMPLNQRADCNYSANRWPDTSAPGGYFGAISFESQDNGSATLRTTPWSLGQVGRFANALTAIAVVYGVQCTQPAVWNRSGIGHHVLFPYQGLLTKSWTNVRGKTCPEYARIAQMDGIRAEVAKRLAQMMNYTNFACGGR